MRPVRLESVKVGDLLGKSLWGDRDELLLAAGYRINEEMLAKLKRRGYHTIYLLEHEDDDLQPEEVVSDTMRKRVSNTVAELHERVRERVGGLAIEPQQLRERLRSDPGLADIIPMGDVTEAVENLLGEVLDSNLSLLTALPMKAKATLRFDHAIDTTVLSVLLGQHFSYEYRELKALGTAALLHDIGKAVFPQLAEREESQLTSSERWLLREHPTYSMLMLRGSEAHSFQEQTAVLEHHERPDGSGYPQGLRSSGEAPLSIVEKRPGMIFRHAEILAVANAYDNLIGGLYDGRLHTPQSAVSSLISGAGTAWNPHVLRGLTKVVQFYPTGSHVRVLNTFSGDWVGWRGIIRKANPYEYAKPVVIMSHDEYDNPVERMEVDLMGEKAVYLELLL